MNLGIVLFARNRQGVRWMVEYLTDAVTTGLPVKYFGIILEDGTVAEIISSTRIISASQESLDAVLRDTLATVIIPEDSKQEPSGELALLALYAKNQGKHLLYAVTNGVPQPEVHSFYRQHAHCMMSYQAALDSIHAAFGDINDEDRQILPALPGNNDAQD